MSSPLVKSRSDVAFQPVRLQNELLEVAVLPFGATLAHLGFCGGPNRVLGLKDSRDYHDHGFSCGPIVGPMANRLAEGKAHLDGHLVQMPRNENGVTTLHSGPEGIQFRAWQIVQHEATRLTLVCTLEDGVCGLPGQRRIEAEYDLDGNALTLRLDARSDRTTLMNLTHHPYWAVTEDARIRVNSAHYLPVNEQKIPTGGVAEVDGTDFDLRAFRAIPGHLDHNLVLSQEPYEHPRPVAWLHTSDCQLTIETTAPGLQVYAGAGLPHLPAEMCNGTQIKPRAGLALEPQLWPDAPNHAAFPTATLLANTSWSQITTYRFEK